MWKYSHAEDDFAIYRKGNLVGIIYHNGGDLSIEIMTDVNYQNLCAGFAYETIEEIRIEPSARSNGMELIVEKINSIGVGLNSK